MEGSRVIILGIVPDYVITNPHDDFRQYRGKKITIIHMYLPDVDWDNHWKEYEKQQIDFDEMSVQIEEIKKE